MESEGGLGSVRKEVSDARTRPQQKRGGGHEHWAGDALGESVVLQHALCWYSGRISRFHSLVLFTAIAAMLQWPQSPGSSMFGLSMGSSLA